MKKTIVFLSLAFLGIALYAERRPWEKFITSESPEIRFPEIKKLQLTNGIPVYLLPSKLAPLATLRVFVEGGSFEEPVEKVGLTSLWSSCVSYSGSEKYPREKLSRILENHASGFSSDVGLRRTSFTVSTLSDYFLSDLEMALEVLASPRFQEDDCNLLREQSLQGIEQRDKNPGRLAHLLAQLQFWEGNIRGRISTKSSLKSIQIQDLKKWHEKMMRGARVTIAVAGDYDEEKLLALLEQKLGTLENLSSDKPNEKALKQGPQPGKSSVWHYAKDIPQSSIVWFSAGIAHNHPDYPALKVFDYMLGGSSFQSFLMQDIRSRRGWAYSVYSFYRAGKMFGQIGMFAQTANKNLPSLLKRVDEILSEPDIVYSEEKLAQAKMSINNKFVFLYDTPPEYLWLKLSLMWDDMPENWLETFQAKINSVTLEDVKRVARKYYRVDRFSKIIVAPKEALPKGLPVRDIRLPE